MPKIKMVQNDTAPAIPFTLKRSGTAVDLTGATVKFKIYDNTTSSRTNDAHNTCTVTSATGGTCSYSFQSGDLPSAGSYTCDLEITYGDGTVETPYDPIVIQARGEA